MKLCLGYEQFLQANTIFSSTMVHSSFINMAMSSPAPQQESQTPHCQGVLPAVPLLEPHHFLLRPRELQLMALLPGDMACKPDQRLLVLAFERSPCSDMLERYLPPRPKLDDSTSLVSTEGSLVNLSCVHLLLI